MRRPCAGKVGSLRPDKEIAGETRSASETVARARPHAEERSEQGQRGDQKGGGRETDPVSGGPGLPAREKRGDVLALHRQADDTRRDQQKPICNLTRWERPERLWNRIRAEALFHILPKDRYNRCRSEEHSDAVDLMRTVFCELQGDVKAVPFDLAAQRSHVVPCFPLELRHLRR